MSKNSKNDAAKSTKSSFKFKLISEMKRNFNTFMTKLGAHISHLVVFTSANIIKVTSKAFYFISSKTSKKFIGIGHGIVYFKNNIINAFKKAEESLFWFKDEIADRRANEGLLKSTGYALVKSGRAVWRNRKAFVTVFNWAAPIFSLVFMVNVLVGVSNLNYGVSVEYNGQKLGVITEESVFDEAEKALQKRINYVDGSEKVVISPKLSVELIGNSEEIVNPNQLVDKMIINTDAEISEGFGVYIDGNFIGAVMDKTPIENTLNSILASYNGVGVKRVQFQKNIEYRPGIYVKDSVKDVNDITNLLSSYTTVDAFYTIQEDDTPIKIASKNNISLNQLISLNPHIEDDCKVGDKVTINVAQPYMGVEVVKDVTYSRSIPYETVQIEDSSIYKGNRETLVNGKEGEEIVTAEVVSLNGLEVSRNVLATDVVSSPVTEKIAIGTKVSKPNGVTISGNGQFCWPVAGGYISSSFGDGRGHKGIDIAAPKGTSIFAAEAGTVIMSQWYSGYGKCIQIRHDDGTVTLYGHASQLIATVGQRVQKGELIALVGCTGNSTGNHLHFEVKVNGSYKNPVNYIT